MRIVGFLPILPAVILVSTSLLGREGGLPAALVHPVVVLGGLALAAALNAWSVFRFGVRREGDDFVGTIAIRVRGGVTNLLAIGLSGVLVAIITAYLFVENFQPR